MRAVSTLLLMLLAGFLVLAAAPTRSQGQSSNAKTAPCDNGQGRTLFSVAGTSESKSRAFLVALQKAVASDDRPKVASMIRYPIATQAGDRNVLVKTPAALVASSELIFTAPLKKIIADARTDCLFVNWKGVMIHDGEIWMGARTNGALRIITINGAGQPPLKPSKAALKIHPKVFSMIDCWESDSECPVVTEINLDAVAADDNQFLSKAIKEEGEFVSCAGEDGRGFMQYRILESVGNRYTVQYLENGGGTLTTSVFIEFAIEKRVIRKDGKAKSVRVLRLLALRHT